jgi:hypothetical protein
MRAHWQSSIDGGYLDTLCDCRWIESSISAGGMTALFHGVTELYFLHNSHIRESPGSFLDSAYSVGTV